MRYEPHPPRNDGVHRKSNPPSNTLMIGAPHEHQIVFDEKPTTAPSCLSFISHSPGDGVRGNVALTLNGFIVPFPAVPRRLPIPPFWNRVHSFKLKLNKYCLWNRFTNLWKCANGPRSVGLIFSRALGSCLLALIVPSETIRHYFVRSLIARKSLFIGKRCPGTCLAACDECAGSTERK